ncbi:MAG TPA: flagellin lysine-N-methylase [Terracidiphilus sp.]|nr:flagellin lysine-N-methylase [Terracidiphilus sp.]HUX28509.1 flagellin lysine-N-methylase [Terracidiphilus sp.]
MSPATPIDSAYAQAFRCIGSDCEDTCCHGWSVPVDRATFEKYQSLPPSPLRALISESITRNVDRTPSTSGAQASASHTAFAQIRMDSANLCPMLTGNHLCRIHAELGEGMLSHACATYPRIVHELGDYHETALALSCPEAARLVLLDRDLLAPKPPTPPQPDARQPHAAPPEFNPEDGPQALPPDYIQIRELVLSVVRIRSYPLWQRMFLLGLMCRRLDAIARGELNRSVTEFVADFRAAVKSGSLRPAMETLPVDPSAQLDVVLRLAGMLLHRSNVSPRFADCVQAFTSGIGNGPDATLDSLTRQYALAHDFSYEPFFRRQPHILENYLVNTVIRCQFPFGRDGMQPGAVPQRSKEFSKLTAQFTLIRGLLIGVAGFHGAAFSSAHVVKTVQTAAKHFEHHPEFLNLAYELLLESQMDGARGMAILLRNAPPLTARAGQPRMQAPAPYSSGPGATTAP